jgi:hypothetical protein
MVRKTSPPEDRGEIQRGVEFIELRTTPSPNFGGGEKEFCQNLIFTISIGILPKNWRIK